MKHEYRIREYNSNISNKKEYELLCDGRTIVTSISDKCLDNLVFNMVDFNNSDSIKFYMNYFTIS